MARFIPNIVSSKIHALDERLGISERFDAVKYAVTDHPATTAAALTLAIPTALAWATTTPWVAIPLTIGIGISAAGTAIGVDLCNENVGQRIAGGIVGGIFGIMAGGMASVFAHVGSSILHDRPYPHAPIMEAQAHLDQNGCLEAGKTFTLHRRGKEFTFAVDAQDIHRVSVASGATKTAHRLTAVTTNPVHDMVSGRIEPETRTLTTPERPGSYEDARSALDCALK